MTDEDIETPELPDQVASYRRSPTFYKHARLFIVLVTLSGLLAAFIGYLVYNAQGGFSGKVGFVDTPTIIMCFGIIAFLIMLSREALAVVKEWQSDVIVLSDTTLQAISQRSMDVILWSEINSVLFSQGKSQEVGTIELYSKGRLLRALMHFERLDQLLGQIQTFAPHAVIAQSNRKWQSAVALSSVRKILKNKRLPIGIFVAIFWAYYVALFYTQLPVFDQAFFAAPLINLAMQFWGLGGIVSAIRFIRLGRWTIYEVLPVAGLIFGICMLLIVAIYSALGF